MFASRTTAIRRRSMTKGNSWRSEVGDWQVVPTLVRRRASIGANATIICGITIGEGAMVGAGATVTHDVPPDSLVLEIRLGSSDLAHDGGAAHRGGLANASSSSLQHRSTDRTRSPDLTVASACARLRARGRRQLQAARAACPLPAPSTWQAELDGGRGLHRVRIPASTAMTLDAMVAGWASFKTYPNAPARRAWIR